MVDDLNFKNLFGIFRNDIVRFLHPKYYIDDYEIKIQIIKSIPKPIIQAFGGLEKMLSFSLLKWKSKYVRQSDCILRIPPEDITEPIMISVDKYTRPIIIIKTMTHYSQYPQIDIIFQRYYNDSRVWNCIFSSPILGGGRIYQNGTLNSNFIYTVKNLLSGTGKIYYYPFDISAGKTKKKLIKTYLCK